MTALDAGRVGPALESRSEGKQPRPARRRPIGRSLLGVAMNVVMFFVLIGIAAASAVLALLYMIAVGIIG